MARDKYDEALRMLGWFKTHAEQALLPEKRPDWREMYSERISNLDLCIEAVREKQRREAP